MEPDFLGAPETPMSQFERLCQSVRAILATDWDPIGVRDVAEAKDEYEPYVAPIANRLIAAISRPDLSNYLLQIERGSMGLGGNNARARTVAEKLRRIEISEA